MPERSVGGNVPVSEILSNSFRETTETGDLRYFIDQQFQEILGREVRVSRAGAAVLHSYPSRFDLLGYATDQIEGEKIRGDWGITVFRQPLVKFLSLGAIAVKRFDMLIEHDVTGLEQFRLTRLFPK